MIRVKIDGEDPPEMQEDTDAITCEALLVGKAGEEPTKSDYEGHPETPPAEGEETGLLAFKDIEDISIVLAPDDYKTDGVYDSLITHCENMKERFAILQAKENDEKVGKLWPPKDSDYAAF